MKIFRYPWFMCHRSQMWQDSWTYGNHAQYICNRPGGQTQCAKISDIQLYTFGLGLVEWGLALMFLFAYWQGTNIRWSSFYVLIILGFISTMVPVINWAMGWEIMKAVGPMNEGARRVCPWDKTR